MSFETSSVELDIQTLLHPSHGNNCILTDPITSVIQPSFNRAQVKSGLGKGCQSNDAWWLKHRGIQRQHSSDSESSTGSSEFSEEDVLVVNGADIGDLPTQYLVEGLRSHEFPVKGTYVDTRIVPGFSYKVRKLGQKKGHVFDGRSLKLQSIGMGYGKRITMEGDNLNFNDNYFYSDTHEEGYGFTLHALSSGERFTVYNEDQQAVGTALITRVTSQRELSHGITEDGDVTKTVSIVFLCDVRYDGEGNFLSMVTSQSVELQAVLVIIKPKKSRCANIKSIRDVNLQHMGICTMENH